jgi:hypothetical protein
VASLTGISRESATGSCRRCPVYCERVVYPAGCVESGCPRVYAYEEGGRTYIGCLEKVYTVEIDLELLEEAQRARGGFGALKTARDPLPVCRTEVETTFAHRACGGCVNPDFLLSAPRRPYIVTARRRPPDTPAEG